MGVKLQEIRVGSPKFVGERVGEGGGEPGRTEESCAKKRVR